MHNVLKRIFVLELRKTKYGNKKTQELKNTFQNIAHLMGLTTGEEGVGGLKVVSREESKWGATRKIPIIKNKCWHVSPLGKSGEHTSEG